MNASIPMRLVSACRMCKEMHAVECRSDEYEKFARNESMVQDCFPNMSAADREFLLTQYCPACQDKIFGTPEDDGPTHDR